MLSIGEDKTNIDISFSSRADTLGKLWRLLAIVLGKFDGKYDHTLIF